MLKKKKLIIKLHILFNFRCKDLDSYFYLLRKCPLNGFPLWCNAIYIHKLFQQFEWNLICLKCQGSLTKSFQLITVTISTHSKNVSKYQSISVPTAIIGNSRHLLINISNYQHWQHNFTIKSIRNASSVKKHRLRNFENFISFYTIVFIFYFDRANTSKFCIKIK